MQIAADDNPDPIPFCVLNHLENAVVEKRLSPIEQVERVEKWATLVDKSPETVEGHVSSRPFLHVRASGAKCAAEVTDISRTDGEANGIVRQLSVPRHSVLPSRLKPIPPSPTKFGHKRHRSDAKPTGNII